MDEGLKRTAYHEAAHAVAQCRNRIRFRYVTIEPDHEEGSAGHVQNAPWQRYADLGYGMLKLRDKDRIEREAVCL